MKTVIISLLAGFALTGADFHNLTDCGSAASIDMKFTRLFYCSGDESKCIITKGQDIAINLVFWPGQYQEFSRLDIRVHGNINGEDVDIPQAETNGCKHVECYHPPIPTHKGCPVNRNCQPAAFFFQFYCANFHPQREPH